ncbi:MAG TPA: c-type cytochrome, partial [Flavisolibacter sp.]|nr:c-type cytochrome [Flavisolibacter sp.]
MAKNTATVFMLLIVFSILLISCHSNTENLNSIAKDSASIATGKTVFDQKCSSCHNFRQDGIGPQLTGVTNNLSVSWIKNFIRSPKAMIDSGDSIAKKLYSGYRTTMPSFAGLTKEEVNGILAFLNSHKSGGKSINGDHKDYKKNIVAPIMPSDLLVGLQLLTQIQASGKEPLTRIVKLDAEPKTGHLYILDLR